MEMEGEMNGYLGYSVTKVGAGSWRIKSPTGRLFKWYMTEKQALAGLAKMLRDLD